MNETSERQAGATRYKGFLEACFQMAFRPGRFYQDVFPDKGSGAAIGFLLVICLCSAGLSGLWVPEKRLLSAALFFANGFSIPFVTAFILYLVSLVLCKGRFEYQTLLGITAYAQITLLGAWIPTLSIFVGAWKFVLIGLGMVKVGNISGGRAFGCIGMAVVLFLALIQVLQPLLT